jgi:hypothetical protein
MRFRPSRLRLARSIVAVGAIALLVFVFFFDWYGGSVQGLLAGTHLTGAAASTTGWQTFTISRWVWLLTIVVALGSTFASVTGYEHDGPVPLSALAAGLGAVASALIVFRIAHHPGPSLSAGSIRISYGIKPGIWFGLFAALAITCAGYVQAQAEQVEPAAPQPRAAEATPEQSIAAFSGLTVRGAPEHATPEDTAGESTPPRV